MNPFSCGPWTDRPPNYRHINSLTFISTLKMEAKYSSETLVYNRNTTGENTHKIAIQVNFVIRLFCKHLYAEFFDFVP